MIRSRYVYIVLAVLAVTYVMSSIQPKTVVKQHAPDPASSTDGPLKHKVLHFNLEGLSDRGAKQWEVNGETAEAVSEYEIKLDNIVAKAYGEESDAIITAEKGMYNKKNNNIILKENVKATINNSEGFSKNYIDVPTAGAPIVKEAKVKTEKTTIVITCDGEVEFNYDKNKAYFRKNVLVTSPDGIIDSDLITVNLDPSTKKVKEIVAEGNVKITKGENVTYCDTATYIENERRIVLTGRPKLVISSDGKIEGAGFLSG